MGIAWIWMHEDRALGEKTLLLPDVGEKSGEHWPRQDFSMDFGADYVRDLVGLCMLRLNELW